MLVSRQFIEPLAGKRLAAVLSWVSLPVQLAILMLSRSYAVCLGRDAIAVIRPPHRRSWTVAGLLEVLGWFVLIDVVVTWLSVFVPVAWWLVAVWLGAALVVNIWWLLWPFEGRVRAKPARLSGHERRALASARRRSVEISAAAARGAATRSCCCRYADISR